MTLLAPVGSRPIEVVVLDPLVFGPAGDEAAMTDVALAAGASTSWLFVALAASLVVNAFFLGAFATDVFGFSAAVKRPVSFELRWLRTGSPRRTSRGRRRGRGVPARRGTHFDRLRALRQELGVLAARRSPTGPRSMPSWSRSGPSSVRW